jgi:hypothetical protein
MERGVRGSLPATPVAGANDGMTRGCDGRNEVASSATPDLPRPRTEQLRSGMSSGGGVQPLPPADTKK